VRIKAECAIRAGFSFKLESTDLGQVLDRLMQVAGLSERKAQVIMPLEQQRTRLFESAHSGEAEAACS
jgi:hypothetical protein